MEERRSTTEQEKDLMFVYNGDIYNDVTGILNFNHIYRYLTCFNSAAEITTK
jgi:hypothetical protein